MRTFRIKDLVWGEDCNGVLVSRFPFDQGSARVSKIFKLYLHSPKTEGVFVIQCSSLMDAMERANNHWRSILIDLLEEVK